MMRYFLIFLMLLTAPLSARAQFSDSKSVIHYIFQLRDEYAAQNAGASLTALFPSATLDRVARRVSQANLSRTFAVNHLDAQKKNLEVRAKEEGYAGATGEIVATRWVPCSSDPQSEAAIEEMGLGFKEIIRKSAEHYKGLTNQTGIAWREYGFSHLWFQKEIDGVCAEKHSITIVFGLPK